MYRLKVRGWEKILHMNVNKKKAGVAILISDKTDFKIKTIIRNKEGQWYRTGINKLPLRGHILILNSLSAEKHF